MADSALHAIPGGQTLIEWFGFVPNFHDAELQNISITNNGRARCAFVPSG